MAYLYMGLCIWYFEGCICTQDGVFGILKGVFVHGMVYLVFSLAYLYTGWCIWYFGGCIYTQDCVFGILDGVFEFIGEHNWYLGSYMAAKVSNINFE